MHRLIPATRRKLIIVFVALMLAIMACTCGNLDTATTTGGGSGSGTVNVVNNSGETICNLHTSPSTDEFWGDDLLTGSSTIEPGGTFTITNVPEGNNDFLAEDCSEPSVTIDEDRDMQVDAGGTITWTVGE